MSHPDPALQALRFPPERPLERDELDRLDAGRLEPVIQTLVRGMHGHWSPDGVPRQGTARVWGVLGGLGQGKSTVVREVLEHLQGRDKTQGIRPRVAGFMWFRVFTQRWGIRRRLDVRTLEASVLSSQHLTATLISQVVLPRLLLWALPMAVLSMAVLLFALGWTLAAMGKPDSLFEAWTKVITYWKSAAALLALPMVISWFAWAKEQQQAGYWEFFLYRIAEWLGVSPDLVVVDDLDRATVEQQKAVLRTLVRHTHLMRCPLIVCFDESELLASEPNPEDPAELLRKLIQVPLRLPPRSREDAVLLAWGAVGWWHRENPRRQDWGEFMRHPVWVGHLARVMMDTHSVGPRRAKYLLAEAVTSVDNIHTHDMVVDFDNACALLLLAAIYQIQPALRRDPELLLVCLEDGGNAKAWNAWNDHPRARDFKTWVETNPRPAAQLKSLMQRSESMMPVRTDWRTLLLGRVEQVRPKPTSRATVRWTADTLEKLLHQSDPNVYEWLREVGAALDKVVLGLSGTEALDMVVLSRSLTLRQTDDKASPPGYDSQSFAEVVNRNNWVPNQHRLCLIWPLMVASLSTLDQPRKRLLFETIDRWLARISDRPSEGVVAVVRSAWVREWCGDDAWEPSATQEQEMMWEPRWLRRLNLGSDEGMRLVLARALRRRGSLDEQTHSAATWRVLLELEHQGVSHAHLAKAVGIGITTPWSTWADEDQSDRLSMTALRFWPPIKVERRDQALHKVSEHMQGIRDAFASMSPAELRRLWGVHGLRDANDRPHALLAWMASPAGQTLHLYDWLSVLRPLCEPHPGSHHWSFSHWRFFWFHEPAVMRGVSAEFALKTSEHWTTAFCLWAQGWAMAVREDAQPMLDDEGKAFDLLQAAVWGSLMRAKPDALDSGFVADAFDWWAKSGETDAHSSDTIPLGLVSLSTEQAMELWQYLLSHANGVNIRDSVEKCLAYWDRLAGAGSTEMAEFAVRTRSAVLPGMGGDDAPENRIF
jgi:hypothetical protein